MVGAPTLVASATTRCCTGGSKKPWGINSCKVVGCSFMLFEPLYSAALTAFLQLFIQLLYKGNLTGVINHQKCEYFDERQYLKPLYLTVQAICRLSAKADTSLIFCNKYDDNPQLTGKITGFNLKPR